MTSLANSVEQIVHRLASNRNIPKYQFERAIEPFIGIFLEEALEQYLNTPIKLVILEYPLKKTGSNQSTNADFLFRTADQNWYFVEIKTERTTLRKEQLQVYQSRVRSKFSDIHEALDEIESASKSKHKYRHLRSKLDEHQPFDGIVEVLYITPHTESPIGAISNDIKWCSFEQLFSGFKSSKHPELWKYVSKLVNAI